MGALCSNKQSTPALPGTTHRPKTPEKVQSNPQKNTSRSNSRQKQSDPATVSTNQDSARSTIDQTNSQIDSLMSAKKNLQDNLGSFMSDGSLQSPKTGNLPEADNEQQAIMDVKVVEVKEIECEKIKSKKSSQCSSSSSSESDKEHILQQIIENVIESENIENQVELISLPQVQPVSDDIDHEKIKVKEILYQSSFEIHQDQYAINEQEFNKNIIEIYEAELEQLEYQRKLEQQLKEQQLLEEQQLKKETEKMIEYLLYCIEQESIRQAQERQQEAERQKQEQERQKIQEENERIQREEQEKLEAKEEAKRKAEEEEKRKQQEESMRSTHDKKLHINTEDVLSDNDQQNTHANTQRNMNIGSPLSFQDIGSPIKGLPSEEQKFDEVENTQDDEENLRQAENQLTEYVQKWAVKTINLTLDIKSQSQYEDGQSSTFDDGSEYRSETSENIGSARAREVSTSNGTVVYRKQKSTRKFPLKKKKKILSRSDSDIDQ